MEGCCKLPDQQRRSSARQIWVVFSAARSVGYLRTEVVHGLTETGCGGDTVDQVGWRPIVVNKMNKQAELVSDAMLYREPVQIAQSITDVVTRSKPSNQSRRCVLCML